MKKLIYLIMAVWAFTSCNDSDEAFTVEISAEGFHFTPIMGGALLQYTLPDDPEIIAINVRYQDVYGNPILKTGSNSTDKLTLTGFNESVNNIPAQITFLRQDYTESQPIDIQFGTLDSSPICFINNAEVQSGWNGCTLSFDNPEGTTGMAHVFYLGSNPIDQQPDTILIESFPLSAGADVKHYTPKQKSAFHTIIVRVEDYRGYMVKERVWENIQAFNTERLDPALFDIFYANSWEVPEEKLGLQYLKDGDVNGATWFEERNRHFYYTFISKENGVGENSEPMYIDLKKRTAVLQSLLCQQTTLLRHHLWLQGEYG